MITCGGCPHPQAAHDRGSGDCAVLHCDCHWRPPTREYPILLTSDAVGDGVVCGGCGRDLHVGDPYRDAPVGMAGDGMLIIEVVCVYC